MARITIEDCLKKIPSRFTLMHIAVERARRIAKGAKPVVESDNKAIVTSLREIAAGKVFIDDDGRLVVEKEE